VGARQIAQDECGLEWLQKCLWLGPEVHNVEALGGSNLAWNHLLDPISVVKAAVAEWPIAEGYVRVRTVHHRNT